MEIKVLQISSDTNYKKQEKINTHLALPQKCPSPICFSECNPKSYTERSSEDQREQHMHITFELETALQWELKVFLFVRHNSCYQMEETSYSVFQNFCIHLLPFQKVTLAALAHHYKNAALPTQNSRTSLTDSSGAVCSYQVIISQEAKLQRHNLSGIKSSQDFTNASYLSQMQNIPQ